jgi:hypothetical protein
MRLVTWLGGALWIGSWYLMFLEITRWHHVKTSLAFDPGPVGAGALRPRPGPPLILLYVVCAAAPLAVAAGLIADKRCVERSTNAS